MLADGGEAISDLSVLRDQPELFGTVASTATAWRAPDSVDGDLSQREGVGCGDVHGRFGYHPLLAFLDNTGEALAGLLRPGNAGSNTAADHIA